MTNGLAAKNRLREFLPSNFVEFDSLLNQMLGPSGLRVGHNNPARWPAGIWEDENAYHVELDVPGISRENVDVTLDKGTLTIAVERKHEESDNTRKGWRDERYYGNVTRSFTLPDTIDADSISAEMNNGVLHVSVAKSPAALPRKVEIK
jgi:HSP20 family protein